MYCPRPAKEGSEWCTHCHVERTVHLEYHEETTNCVRCKAAVLNQTGRYCDTHRAEIDNEIDKRIAEYQKNEATAVGAGSAPPPAAPAAVEPAPTAPGVPVEPAPTAPAAAAEPKKTFEYTHLSQKQKDEEKRKAEAKKFADEMYRIEMKRCAGCIEAKKSSNEYCDYHLRKLDETYKWRLAMR
jgi:hypothetical protein